MFEMSSNASPWPLSIRIRKGRSVQPPAVWIEAGEVRITLDLLLRLQVALNAPTEYLWFPFASTIEDASEATVLQALQNAFVIFGDEEGASDEG